MLVRPFEERDAGTVARFMYASFRGFLGDRITGPQPESLYIGAMHRVADGTETAAWVAEVDGRVAGYIAVNALLERGLGTLSVIGVDPETQARGIGAALFREADRFWRERKMRKVYTCVSSINEKAQAYYKKMGFEVEGTLKRHFYPDVDELQLALFYD